MFVRRVSPEGDGPRPEEFRSKRNIRPDKEYPKEGFGIQATIMMFETQVALSPNVYMRGPLQLFLVVFDGEIPTA